MTGYLLETCGDASFARNGWLAHIRAIGVSVINSMAVMYGSFGSLPVGLVELKRRDWLIRDIFET